MNWVITDDDSMQHMRHIKDRCYEIIDSVCLPTDDGFVCRCMVDLDDYEIDNDFEKLYLKPYDYDNAVAVTEIYGEYADQIIAECIAETEILKKENAVFSGTYDDCLSYIRLIVCGENK